MSEEKKYTERELRECQQLAFCHGWYASIANGDAQQYAKRAYPLPRVTRPRVVKDPTSVSTREWRYVDGYFETRTYASCVPAKSREWHRVDFAESYPLFVEKAPPPTDARVQMWADLLANPTEEGEGEG